MDKKEALLLLLEELVGIFEAAEEMHAYVLSPEYDDSLTDELLELFQSEIRQVHGEEKKRRVEAAMDRIRKERKAEAKEAEEERNEAENILGPY